MAIQGYFISSLVIKRIRDTDGIQSTPYATATIDAQVQRVGDTNDVVAMSFGATHKAWIDISANVKDGDKVVDERDNIYDVVAVTDEGENIAINEHKEVMLRIYDGYTNVPS